MGDIIGYVKFIQGVTSLPRWDDWAERFGSNNRAVDPKAVEEESISGLWMFVEQE